MSSSSLLVVGLLHLLLLFLSSPSPLPRVEAGDLNGAGRGILGLLHFYLLSLPLLLLLLLRLLPSHHPPHCALTACKRFERERVCKMRMWLKFPCGFVVLDPHSHHHRHHHIIIHRDVWFVLCSCPTARGWRLPWSCICRTKPRASARRWWPCWTPSFWRPLVTSKIWMQRRGRD